MLLKKATVEQASAKVGIFAPQGAGKTTTSILIAIGLSKTYHDGAPIAFMDTENGSDYVVPICDVENIQMMNFKSRAFKDMKAGLKEAEQSGCCVYIVDSYTHPWKELVDSFKAKSNRKKLEFHHMDALKTLWQSWTDSMLNAPLHIILAGRLGYVWDRAEDEDDGTKGELIRLGTKMKSESEAGYEPSLLIEMEGLQPDAARAKRSRAKQGTIVHHAYVLKDRWRILNGRTFTFKDMNEYKVGGYKPVFEAFRPHFDKLAIGTTQKAVDGSRSSESLFDAQGDSAHAHRIRRVTITVEEIQGTLVKLWPRQDAESKALKQLAIETLFQTRSWTAVESKSLEALEAGLDALKMFEEKVEDGQSNAIIEQAECLALLCSCAQQIAKQAQEASESVGIL